MEKDPDTMAKVEYPGNKTKGVGEPLRCYVRNQPGGRFEPVGSYDHYKEGWALNGGNLQKLLGLGSEEFKAILNTV